MSESSSWRSNISCEAKSSGLLIDLIEAASSRARESNIKNAELSCKWGSSILIPGEIPVELPDNEMSEKLLRWLGDNDLCVQRVLARSARKDDSVPLCNTVWTYLLK